MDVRGAAEVGLGVAFVVALVGQAWAIADSWGGSYLLFDGVAGALVCLVALGRRRHLGWAAVIGIVIGGLAVVVAQLARLPSEPGPVMALALAVLVGAAVRALPMRQAVGIAGAAAVLACAALVVRNETVGRLTVVAWLVALSVGLGWRLLDTRRQAAADAMRRDERLELARELHDLVAHHVTGVVLQAQAARVVQRRYPERLEESLAGIETAGGEALAAMRRVVGLLRDTDDVVSATAGPEPLTSLVRRFDGPPVRLHLPDGEPAGPPGVTSTVYRVVQEALTNVARHAPRARAVTVSVAVLGDAITIEVADTGPGVAKQHHRGYGLIGMRERVEALNGTLDAGPHDGGWAVRARLPMGERR